MIWRRKQRRTAQSKVAAVESRKRAEAQLAEVRAQTPKYRELAESLRELREANNFAAAIETSFRGGNP